MDALLPAGWHRCGWGLRWLLGRQRSKPLSATQCEERRRRAGNPIPADACTVVPSWRAHMRMLPLVWWLSPPLGYGASRFVPKSDSAREAFVEALGEEVTAELLDDVREGLEGARSRRSRIEQRALFLAGAAGITGVLLVASKAYELGRDAHISDTARIVAVAALALAFLSIAACLVYAVLAVMRTFGNVAARGTLRLLERSQLDEEAARRQAVGAFLAAQFRVGHVADWKVARLKRATVAFLVAVASAFVAGGALLVSAIP